MPEELNRYLTESEKEQMNALLSKAIKRREEERGTATEEQCQFLFAQCRKEPEAEERALLEINCKVDLKNLLKELCDCCPRCQNEDLPF